MRLRMVVASLLVFAATPALADFYVVQDAKTKKCDIVEEKPDGTTRIMIGMAPYASRDEAKAARKAAPKCKGHI